MIQLSPRFTISFSSYYHFLLIFHSIPSCKVNTVKLTQNMLLNVYKKDVTFYPTIRDWCLDLIKVWILSASFLILICLFLL